MAKRLYNERWPSVIPVDGELWLVNKDGEAMGSIQSIRLVDELESFYANAEIKLVVNIGHPEAEALADKIRTKQY